MLGSVTTLPFYRRITTMNQLAFIVHEYKKQNMDNHIKLREIKNMYRVNKLDMFGY